MATANSIRARKRAHVHSRSKSFPKTKTVPKMPISGPVKDHLLALARTLRDIDVLVTVSCGALREADEYAGTNVADVLRKHVSNRLSLEADGLAVLLGLKQHEDDVENAEENS